MRVSYAWSKDLEGYTLKCFLALYMLPYACRKQEFFYLSPFAKFWTATIGFVMPACPSFRPRGTSRLLLDVFSWNTKFGYFLENVSRKFKFYYNLVRIAGTLHEDRYTFMVTSRSVLLRMRNFSVKSYRKYKTTHFVFNNFFPQNRAV